MDNKSPPLQLNVSNFGLDNEGYIRTENNSDKSDTVIKFNVYKNNTPKRKKSLVQLTREVLPRLENYRNSRRAVKRPSLGELHEGDETNKQSLECGSLEDGSDPIEGIKLGWIQGVLIPVILNIWGVMLFLRVSWVVAEAGTGLTLVIIGLSSVVCVVTTLSLSAICTNGEVKGGGIYYIISRSLGPEFGASVGVVFAFANAVSASINTIGFCNSLSDLLKEHGLQIIDGGINDTRVVGTVAMVVMILICAIGMEWESKAQNLLIVIIVGAIFDFILGTCLGPSSDLQIAQGFVGLNATLFVENWGPAFRRSQGQNYDFFQVFAVFFPSVTGIQAGANISGDLKDPASAIPKGTFLALFISMISYAVFALLTGAAASRDATGNVADLINGTLTKCVDLATESYNCKQGSFNNYQMMTIMSYWGPFIYAGCFAATLSTALTNLLSVPRLIQALGIDRIYPGLIFFSKGYGKHGEPYRGYVLTFFVAVGFLLIGDINSIAPLISNFYLASYALINFCTFHAALIKPLGWRPTFRYYNTWLSLGGFIMCVVIMFLINYQSSLITFILILGLYLVVVYRKPDVNWGSSTQAQTYKTALTTAHRLINIGEHVKNYKPQILLLSGSPIARPPLIDFASLITKNNSLLIVGDVVQERLAHKTRASKISSVYSWLRTNKVKAFYNLIDDTSFELGAKALLQTTGIGKLSPNVLMLGYKNNWRTCSRTELVEYFNVLHAAFDQRLAVAILRVPDGLDYSRISQFDEKSNSMTLRETPSKPVLFRTSPSNVLMHADSNLSLEKLGTEEGEMPINKIENNKEKKEDEPPSLRKKLNPLALCLDADSTLDLNKAVEKMSLFKIKQTKGFIDVWWLYDDGGLTMLLPYIISTRHFWSSCKLRVFALSTNNHEEEEDRKNMEKLLAKFRLDYFSLHMVSISDKPQESTIKFFNEILDGFKAPNNEENEMSVSDTEFQSLQEKTYRQLRLRELLLEHSSDASLVVMSLPLARKGTLSAPLYMAWLEVLTKDLPPYLLVRGNQQSVLTFYS